MEGRHSHDRPEDLLLRHGRAGIDIVDQRRLDEESLAVTATLERLTPKSNGGCRSGAFDEGEHAFALALRDEPAECRILEGRTDLDPSENVGDPANELFMDALLNQQA